MKIRPSLLEMLRANPQASNSFQLYPFPNLVLSRESTPNLSQRSDSVSSFKSLSSANSDKKANKLQLIGLEKCLWTPDELKKWVEARRQKFPCEKNRQSNEKIKEENLSKIEKKLRVNLMLLDDDPEKRRKIQKTRKFIFKTATVIRANKRSVPISNLERTDKKKESVLDEGPVEMAAVEKTEERVNKNSKMEGLGVKDIIAHLKDKKRNDFEMFNEFFSSAPKGFNYNYIQNTLFVNLVVDDIIEERNQILNMIDFIVTNDFLQKKNG